MGDLIRCAFSRDAIHEITAVLSGTGMPGDTAHTRAIDAWNRADSSQRAFAIWYAAEKVWQASVGDDHWTRSMFSYAEGSPDGRAHVAKILRDVTLVFDEQDRWFGGLVPDRERLATQARLAQWLTLAGTPGRTLAEKRAAWMDQEGA